MYFKEITVSNANFFLAFVDISDSEFRATKMTVNNIGL